MRHYTKPRAWSEEWMRTLSDKELRARLQKAMEDGRPPATVYDVSRLQRLRMEAKRREKLAAHQETPA